MTDFLTIIEQTPESIWELVDQGLDCKTNPAATAGALDGKGVGLFFMKPSTRTHVSAEIGSVQLGAHPVVLKNEEVGLGGRESVEDVARTLDRYLDALAFRVFDHGHLVTVAEHAAAPVINLLSDIEHPCQAIADLMTICEHGDPEGATLAYIGDGNNVCHSLMVGAAMVGMEVRVATPAGFEPSDTYVAAASKYSKVEITNDASRAVEGADVVYTDVWASMGQEDERAARLRSFAGFSVDEALFAQAADDAVFLHCLPAHHGEELTAGVAEHERSRIFDQAENRLHSFKAILLNSLA